MVTLLLGTAGAAELTGDHKNAIERDVLYLKNDYAIRIIAVDPEIFPHKLWLALEKDGNKLDDAVIDSGDEYSYNTGEDAVKTELDMFANGRKSIVFLKNCYCSE